MHRYSESADDEHRCWDRCADSAFWTESIWLHLVSRARERSERGRGALFTGKSKITKMLKPMKRVFELLAAWFLALLRALRSVGACRELTLGRLAAQHRAPCTETAVRRMSGLVLPAAASLVDQLDKRVLVILRDGRNLVGVMRSFDQFSNVVLEDAVERRVVIPAKEGVNAVYGDAPLGLYVVRGDSIVLLGEVDDAREASPQHPARMDIRDVLELERAGLAERAVVWDIEES